MRIETYPGPNSFPLSSRDRAGAPAPPSPHRSGPLLKKRRPRWAILSVASESREEVKGRSCGPLFCNVAPREGCHGCCRRRERAPSFHPLSTNAECNSIVARTSPVSLASHTAMQFAAAPLRPSTNIRDAALGPGSCVDRTRREHRETDVSEPKENASDELTFVFARERLDLASSLLTSTHCRNRNRPRLQTRGQTRSRSPGR
jgi:hypothetical protein